MPADLNIPPGGSFAHLQLAFEVASSVDLDQAQALVRQGSQRETIQRRQRTPEYFQFRPAPLRIDLTGPSLPVGARWRTEPRVEVTLYDFGALAVSYAVPIAGPLEDLLPLGLALYENPGLLADARARVEALLAQIGPALQRRRFADLVEDYVVYRVQGCQTPTGLAAVLGDPAFRRATARLLRAEAAELSTQEVDDALASVVSYTPSDATIIDWNASLTIGGDADDVLAVLEFANVELLEMRYIDDRLDAMLDEAYRSQQRPARGVRRLLGMDKNRAVLRRLAAMQVDSALLFEGINNALKLLGDQYLARVYRVTAQRLHLPDWDATVLRKINTLQGIYQKLSDEQSTIRMELLEVLIILLIVASIILPILGFK